MNIIKKKNFSGNNLGQHSITRQLLEVEDFMGSILEPACGNGAILNILKNATGYDIEKDFFKETKKYNNIVTNPPFSLSFDFLMKAKQIATKKIAFLLPLSYLHGKKRFDFVYQDKDFPLARVYIFTRYPMLGNKLREDGKYKTGMMVYAWYIWEKNYKQEPIIRWIDNNKNVVSTTKKKRIIN